MTSVPDIASRRQSVDDELTRLLPPETGPAVALARAMRYAVLGGGKRLRPLLALATCEACGGEPAVVLAPAAALELIHTYSLIHDDLPAMDDDDLRRGRPTVHRTFGEATAILAGDALLTLAFEVLGSKPHGPDFSLRRAQAVEVVACRAGFAGMVGGQQADLEAEGEAPDAGGLRWIHLHKTGALMAACAEVGAIHAGAAPHVRRCLASFGESVGLAFQIADDILDVTSTAEALGKTPGKDRRSGKATYPALFGVEESRREAERLVQTALERLREADLRDTGALEALARYAARRMS